MFPWWLHVKRFGMAAPTFQDTSRWQKRGNVYTLRKPDMDKDKWVTSAQFKAVNKLESGKRLNISGTANANIIDRVQERLDPRGLDATDYLRNAQLLAHHSYYHSIGQVEVLDIQDDGVHFGAWIGDPEKVGGPEHLTDMQREIRSLVAQGIMKAVSVGFIPHKFRAPLYNDNGEMEEPLVIESWELLELSVVAVPCNQLSLFQMRDAQAQAQPEKRIFSVPFNANGGDPLKFLRENFTKDQLTILIENVSEPGDPDASDETDDTDEGENDNVALKPKLKAQGGKASDTGNGKGKGAPEEEDEEDEEDEDGAKTQKEMLTLLRTMNAGQSKTLELLGDMMKHLLKSDAPADDEEDDEDDEKGVELDARISALEDGQKEIVEAIKALAGKIK